MDDDDENDGDEQPRKPLSGAAKRKLRREREAVLADDLEEDASPEVDVAGEFAKLGPPPLNDPDTALVWVRRLQLVALHVAATAKMTPAVRERLKNVRELAATVGMTQNRAELEEVASRVEDLIAGERERGAIRLEPTAGRPRPPGSRGTRRRPTTVQ